MPGGNPGRCAYCGRRILFVKMKSGKSMPEDEEFVNYKKVKGGKERVVTPSGEVVACTRMSEAIKPMDTATYPISQLAQPNVTESKRKRPHH